MAKRVDEREFCLRLAIQEKYYARELERQLNSGLFELTVLADFQMPARLQQLPQDVMGLFRDTYAFEFLDLPHPTSLMPWIRIATNVSSWKKLTTKMVNFFQDEGKEWWTPQGAGFKIPESGSCC